MPAVVLTTFSDEQAAREYLESRRWPNGVCCPTCGVAEKIVKRGGKRAGYYRCPEGCGEFTVRTGTIFERSHVSLRAWCYSMYLLVTARKGISSLQLSKQIGVTQRTAWFILHRLREACGAEMQPPEMDRITDAVFAHAPKPKSDAAKKRQRRAKRKKRARVESKD